jgi:hypothetical protein
MIADGRRRGLAAAAACLLLGALAPAARATIGAQLDGGSLVLTDVAGTADDLTLSAAANGAPFIAFAQSADAALGPLCALTSTTFNGYQCPPVSAVRIDAGAGDDRIDASRMSSLMRVTLGAGSDVVQTGSGDDQIVVTDGARDVVDCGAGNDVIDGIADPNDDIAADCEVAQRSFASSMLPKSLTVGSSATVTLAIGTASVPLRFVATLATAPPKHGQHAAARTLARTSVAARTGAVKIRFKLLNLSKGFLSRRPSIRVQVAVTAIGADGRRSPLSLHSQAPGPHPKLVTLYDNQVRLLLPAKLRHP